MARDGNRHRGVWKTTFDPLAPAIDEIGQSLSYLRKDMRRDGEDFAPESRAVMNLIWRGHLHLQAELAARDADQQLEKMIYPAGRGSTASENSRPAAIPESSSKKRIPPKSAIRELPSKGRPSQRPAQAEQEEIAEPKVQIAPPMSEPMDPPPSFDSPPAAVETTKDKGKVAKLFSMGKSQAILPAEAFGSAPINAMVSSTSASPGAAASALAKMRNDGREF